MPGPSPSPSPKPHKLPAASGNLYEMMMLETFMYFLYKDTALRAHVRKPGPPPPPIKELSGNGVMNFVEKTADMLAGEELHDGLTILRHLKERLSQTAIRKKIRSATDGAFLTRADSPKVHYLFKQLIQKAKASGDSVLEAWLRGVQEEENIHEMLVSKMLRSLGVEYEFKRNPPDKRLVSSFLKMGSGFFFSQTADGFEGSLRAFRRMADSAHKVRGAVMHIRRNLTLAAYTYRPW